MMERNYMSVKVSIYRYLSINDRIGIYLSRYLSIKVSIY